MTLSSRGLKIVCMAAVLASSPAFLSPCAAPFHSSVRAQNDEGETAWTVDDAPKESSPSNFGRINIPNPLAELADMFSNFDDIVDDFFNKRMGNGEVFYGKRKYKPSGKVTTNYNGGGFSDWRKIEAAREFREERARMREEAKENKVSAGKDAPK
ncbi:hypothetical protein ACHAWF_009287 [Thalassiosira exigua]